MDTKTLKENDFNLAAGRYKPPPPEKAPEEDPQELINEILIVDGDITSGLKPLFQLPFKLS